MGVLSCYEIRNKIICCLESDMHFCKKTRKPLGISELKGLVIDRCDQSKRDYFYVCPNVCIALDRTLFYRIKPSDTSELCADWLKNAVEVVAKKQNAEEKWLVLARPGATELLMALDKYASPMVYSSESDEFIDAALLALSIAQGDPDIDYCDSEAEAYMDLYVWSQKQCILTNEGYKKSLGLLSELSDHGINDHWLIDHRPDLADFPSHVIAVSEFTGDPADRDLYRVMDQIFIN